MFRPRTCSITPAIEIGQIFVLSRVLSIAAVIWSPMPSGRPRFPSRTQACCRHRSSQVSAGLVSSPAAEADRQAGSNHRPRPWPLSTRTFGCGIASGIRCTLGQRRFLAASAARLRAPSAVTRLDGIRRRLSCGITLGAFDWRIVGGAFDRVACGVGGTLNRALLRGIAFYGICGIVQRRARRHRPRSCIASLVHRIQRPYCRIVATTRNNEAQKNC